MLAETNRQLKQIEQSERLQRQTNKQQKVNYHEIS